MTQSWRKCQSFLYWEPAMCAWEGALALAQRTWKFCSQLRSSVMGSRGFTCQCWGQREVAEISKRELPLVAFYFCVVWLALCVLGCYGAWHVASWGSYYCLINWEHSGHYLPLGPVRTGVIDTGVRPWPRFTSILLLTRQGGELRSFPVSLSMSCGV